MKIKFEVRELDKGFIVNEDGKETAIENDQSLESHMVARFKNEISKSFNRLSIKRSEITIEIEQS